MYQQIKDNPIVFWQQVGTDSAVAITYSEGAICLLQGKDVIAIKLENIQSFIDAINFYIEKSVKQKEK